MKISKISYRLISLVCIASAPYMILPRPAQADGQIAMLLPTPADNNHPNMFSPAAGLAKILSIESTLTHIHKLNHEEGPQSLASLSLRQQLIQSILRTILEAHSVLARIDSEMTYADEAREKLEAARDRAVTLNDLTNFLSTGAITTTGSSIQIAHNAAGNLVQAAGGLNSIALSARSLMKQRGPRPLVSAKQPNMLAKPLGFEVELAVDYPVSIWAYLNSPMPGTNVTRRSALIKRWYAEKNFVGNAKERMAQLSGVKEDFRSTIELLDTRRDMLSELRAEISKIDIDLLELLNAIDS